MRRSFERRLIRTRRLVKRDRDLDLWRERDLDFPCRFRDRDLRRDDLRPRDRDLDRDLRDLLCVLEVSLAFSCFSLLSGLSVESGIESVAFSAFFSANFSSLLASNLSLLASVSDFEVEVVSALLE